MYFGLKAHGGADSKEGVLHSVCTAQSPESGTMLAIRDTAM
jgi:hypothetical protein